MKIAELRQQVATLRIQNENLAMLCKDLKRQIKTLGGDPGLITDNKGILEYIYEAGRDDGYDLHILDKDGTYSISDDGMTFRDTVDREEFMAHRKSIALKGFNHG